MPSITTFLSFPEIHVESMYGNLMIYFVKIICTKNRNDQKRSQPIIKGMHNVKIDHRIESRHACDMKKLCVPCCVANLLGFELKDLV